MACREHQPVDLMTGYRVCEICHTYVGECPKTGTHPTWYPDNFSIGNNAEYRKAMTKRLGPGWSKMKLSARIYHYQKNHAT